MAMLKNIQTNPSSFTSYMQDPRMMTALSVGLGMKVMSGDEAAAQGMGGEESSRAPPPPKAPEPEPEPEPEPVDEEEKAKKRRKEEALEHKSQGNNHYKKKEFDAAIKCYDAALDLDDTDISFLTNKYGPFACRGEVGLGGGAVGWVCMVGRGCMEPDSSVHCCWSPAGRPCFTR
jgi:stress-induced-phosphoprotein 1